MEANPFPEQSGDAPRHVILALEREQVRQDAAEVLTQEGVAGEQAVEQGEAMWFHFQLGVRRSRLRLAIIDRALGSPATLRNARTILALSALLRF